MAAEIRSFTVTTGTGVAKAAPLVTNLTMPARIVRSIEIRVPPGPNGELGFQIGAVGQSIIPANPAEFVVTSDEVITWEFDATMDSGAWQCISYNTGNYPHTIQIRFSLDLVPPSGIVPASTVIDASSIQDVGSTLISGDTDVSSTPSTDLTGS